MPIPVTGKRKLLGRIDLNGLYFEAYQEETGHGDKRFRLQSFPPIDPEREAGFIRYLINEGFIEKRWPRLSEKIQEEAGWAFFFQGWPRLKPRGLNLGLAKRDAAVEFGHLGRILARSPRFFRNVFSINTGLPDMASGPFLRRRGTA
jgi:hypothetical protein